MPFSIFFQDTIEEFIKINGLLTPRIDLIFKESFNMSDEIDGKGLKISNSFEASIRN